MREEAAAAKKKAEEEEAARKAEEEAAAAETAAKEEAAEAAAGAGERSVGGHDVYTMDQLLGHKVSMLLPGHPVWHSPPPLLPMTLIMFSFGLCSKRMGPLPSLEIFTGRL